MRSILRKRNALLLLVFALILNSTALVSAQSADGGSQYFCLSSRMRVTPRATLRVLCSLVPPRCRCSRTTSSFSRTGTSFRSRATRTRAGQTATLEVTRPGVGIIGSAQATVSAGGVAFEVNHPGGVCWGAGTGLNVTPDIRPGDVVSIRFGATPAGDVRTQDAFVTADAVQNGTTVTVGGHIGLGVIRANTEQRIIDGALVDTAVGKRDVRAIPSDVLVPSANNSYSSMLQFPTADTFLATYLFEDAATAAIVANAGLGERMMSWEVVDAANNRQGITIAEFGEAGGPGFGGCPNGPLQSGPPGPTNVLAATQANGDIIVTWKPAEALPGTPAITGYRVQRGRPDLDRQRTGRNADGDRKADHRTDRHRHQDHRPLGHRAL